MSTGTLPDFSLEDGFRWFGPNDPVPLAFIRQAGANAIFSSLHQIPYGEVWTREAIATHRRQIEQNGMRWAVVESVPVHEDIKTGLGDLKRLFENYVETLRRLAEQGIRRVVYNFMPVLDWIRTDMKFALPDGSECLHFDPVRFAAFDLFALQRKGAEADFVPEVREQAAIWWNSLDAASQNVFIQTIIDVFPGQKWGLSLDHIRAMLARYSHLDSDGLSKNLARFLDAVIPTAEKVGVSLALHPDDPPFPVLGLPRIVSNAKQIDAIFSMVDSPANGLCFCTGSLSARPDNDLPAMAKRFAPRIHAVHLRSTQRNSDGSFFEADHLAGSVPMAAVVRELLAEQDRRFAANRATAERIPFRPDHGHTMMDDLRKPPGITPGYSCIGRMRGLAELRGLMQGLRA